MYTEIGWNAENVMFVRHTSLLLSLSLSLSLSQVNDGTTLRFGKRSQIASTVYRLLQLLMIRYSVATEVSVPTTITWLHTSSGMDTETRICHVSTSCN